MVVKYAVVAGLVALVMAGSPAYAGDYTSSFGFGISVPDEYLVLTRDEVQKNADVFIEDGGDRRLREIPSAMRREVDEQIEDLGSELDSLAPTAKEHPSFVEFVFTESHRHVTRITIRDQRARSALDRIALSPAREWRP